MRRRGLLRREFKNKAKQIWTMMKKIKYRFRYVLWIKNNRNFVGIL